MTALRSSRPAALRAAAAAVAVAAAFGPTAELPGRRVFRVLLVDASQSCRRSAATAEELAAFRAGPARGDTGAVIAFADGAEVLSATGAPSDARPVAPTISPWASSLALGLEAAARLCPEDARTEILVATDGHVTDDLARLRIAADALRDAAGGPVAMRVLARAAGGLPSSVGVLRGPGRANVGEVVALEARGVATAGGATVELVGEGRVLERRRVDRAGPFRLVFTRVADVPGVATWEARTPDADGARPAAARVVVAAPGTCVVVTRGAVRPSLAAAGAGGAVLDLARESAASQAIADRIAGADAVVLDDVAASDLRAIAGPLRAFVRGGGGVLVVGGPASFSAGGWRPDDEVESLLPLRTAPPDAPGAVLYLAIDGSGSMGETWPSAGAAVLRDTAVRDAARALVASAPRGATVLLRRFRDTPVPAGEGPAVVALSGSDAEVAQRRADGARAVDALPGPGGSTAFVPVLTEAADLLASRTEPTRTAILLTDGRSAEAAADVAAALRRLIGAGVRVAVVTPGRLDAGASDASLLRAAADMGTGAVAVRAADEPSGLADVLVETQRAARDGEAVLVARDVAPTEDATVLSPDRAAPTDWPRRALRMNRTWAAPDAVVLARAADGVPLAAVRTEAGTGRVGAVAARAGDGAWLDGDAGVAMTAAILRGVRRRGSASVRVSAEGDSLLAVFDLSRGAAAPVRAAFFAGGRELGASPLGPPGPDGAVAAPLAEGADRVVFSAADGTAVAAAGVDRAASPELLDPAPADLGAVARRLARPEPGGDRRPAPLRPWLAATAVILLVGASVKSRARSAR